MLGKAFLIDLRLMINMCGWERWPIQKGCKVNGILDTKVGKKTLIIVLLAVADLYT